MADFNDDDLAKLTASLNAMQRGVVGLNRTLDKATASAAAKGTVTEKATRDYLAGAAAVAEGAKKAAKTVGDTAVGIGRNIKGLDAEFGAISKAMGMFKASLSLVAGIGVMADVIKDSVDNYRKMLDAGQSFGGSMLEMQIAAAEARMPLADLSAAVSSYSKAIAITGVKSFGEMNKGLRDSLTGFGMLGFKTEELASYMGDYLEVQRASGLLDRLNASESVSIMQKIAVDATRVSEAMGTSRKEILKMTMETLSEGSIRSRLMLESSDAAVKFTKGLSTASTYFAGIPGEGGKLLSKMMAESFGKGTSMMSEGMQMFSSVGMAGMGSVMDNISSKIKSGTLDDGDMERARQEILQMGESSLSSLKWLADTGDANAAAAIDMIGSLKSMSAQQLKEVAAQQKATQFFLNLQSTLQSFTGFFREKFFKAIEGAMGGFNDLADSPVMKTIKDELGLFAEKLGGWFAGKLTPENIQGFTESMANMIQDFGKWWDTTKPILQAFVEKAIKFVDVVDSTISALAGFVKAIIDAGPAAALAAVGVMIVAKRAISQFYEGFKESLLGGGNLTKGAMVTGGAMHVRIIGGGAGGSGGVYGDAGDSGGDRKKKTKNNRASRRAAARAGGVAAATPAAPKAASIIAEKGLMKGSGAIAGGKMANVLTKVPKGIGLGALVGIGADLGADAYKNAGLPGAETVGVLGDAASWAATGAVAGSVIPGVGTLIGGLVGGALGGGVSLWNNRDAVGSELSSLFGGGSKTPKVAEMTTEEQTKINATNNTEIVEQLKENANEAKKQTALAKDSIDVQVASTQVLAKANSDAGPVTGSEYQ